MSSDATSEPSDDAVPHPEFEALFPDGAGHWFTPRLAARVWLAAELLADLYPEMPEMYEHRLPVIARGRGDEFAARLSQAASELRDDITRGNPPFPRSLGEEIVLWWILEDVQLYETETSGVEYEMVQAIITKLPIRDSDDVDEDDVEGLFEYLYQDHDFRFLYSRDLDGIDDSEAGAAMGIGSQSPDAWFVPYDSTPAEDERPPFTRDGEEETNVFTLVTRLSFAVSDPAEVQRAAVEALRSDRFSFTSEQERDEEITRVQLSIEDALLVLADASGALIDVPGVEERSEMTSVEVGDVVDEED